MLILVNQEVWYAEWDHAEMGDDRAGCGHAGFSGLWRRGIVVRRHGVVRGDDRWHGKSIGKQFVFLVVIFLLFVIIFIVLFFFGRHHRQ